MRLVLICLLALGACAAENRPLMPGNSNFYANGEPTMGAIAICLAGSTADRPLGDCLAQMRGQYVPPRRKRAGCRSYLVNGVYKEICDYP